MKKRIYLGLALCMGAALLTGCDKDKEKNKEQEDRFSVGSDYEETAFGMRLQMVAVQGGTFTMGATSEQGDDAYDWEKPVHSVTLDGFYIGAFEVTQSQWAAVMGTHPIFGDNYPMYNLIWDEAVAFCEKLSAQTGKKYRLPTEAEWEYAARGGNKSDGTKYAGSNNIDEVAWYADNLECGISDTHPVGQKRPNALGLYDMSGNAWEWCQDWSDPYGSSPVVNPQGPISGAYRVLRGGGFDTYAVGCRVSYRIGQDPSSVSGAPGFRVVCER